ncbi:MAG: CBS domain-containing protein, partial [Vicingaceae bacterium]
MNQSKCRVGVKLRSLLEAINEEPFGTAFIENEQDVLVGIITDGDFRRMLLNGKELDDTIEKVDLSSFI